MEIFHTFLPFSVLHFNAFIHFNKIWEKISNQILSAYPQKEWFVIYSIRPKTFTCHLPTTGFSTGALSKTIAYPKADNLQSRTSIPLRSV